jgi:hypothetical protein
MSININNPAYSALNTYAVLAASGITTVNTTTITNGKALDFVVRLILKNYMR